jgi:hypothetical protein
MSFDFKIAPQARVMLESVIAMQEGKAGELRIYFNLLEKLKTTLPYRQSLIIRRPNGNEEWNEEALAIAPPFEVSLEQEEIDQIRKLLAEWRFKTADLRWINPLKTELDTVGTRNKSSKEKR